MTGLRSAKIRWKLFWIGAVLRRKASRYLSSQAECFCKISRMRCLLVVIVIPFFFTFIVFFRSLHYFFSFSMATYFFVAIVLETLSESQVLYFS